MKGWAVDFPGPGGFSLLEVVVALTLLAVGVTGVAGLLLLAGRALEAGAVLDRAVGLATTVADSLALSSGGAGEWVGEGARVRWNGGTGWVELTVFVPEEAAEPAFRTHFFRSGAP